MPPIPRLSVLLFAVLLAGVSPPAIAQPYAPAVDALSLLDLRFYPASGGFLVEGLELVFPPPGGGTAALDVLDAAGQTVATVPLDVRPLPDFPAFAALAPQGPGVVRLDAAGDFALRVTLDGAEIARLPYTLTREAGSDPFDPQTAYYQDGPWRTLGFLAAPADRPDAGLTFGYWTSLREVGRPGRTPLALRLQRGGMTVAQSLPFVIDSPHWQHFDQPLVQPDERAPFTLADLTRADGSYALTLLAEGAPVKTYRFRVEGGAVVPHPRSALPVAPSPDFLSPRRVDTSAGSSSRYVLESLYWMEAE